jgi:cytochrome c peroxidase
MRIARSLGISLLAAACFASCNYDRTFDLSSLDIELKQRVEHVSPTGELSHFILPESTEFDKIPQDFKSNPLTTEKVLLGKMLFFETAIAQAPMRESGRGTYSCGTCHIPSAGFRPGRFQGVADGGMGFGDNGEYRVVNPEYNEPDIDAQGARPLTVLNVAYVTNTFWNGQFGGGYVNAGTEALWNEADGTANNALGLEAIEAQNIEGLEVHRMEMSRELADEYGYKLLFDLAFPDVPEATRYSKYNTAMALSAYIRSLTTHKAPFQDWLRGDFTSMTDQEKRGAVLFFGEARCYSCHHGTSLNAIEFYALGVHDLHTMGGLKTGPEDNRNLGRGGFTKNPADNYKFKVPQLYNLADAPFYFHGSSKQTLEEVVDYFIEATPENPNVPQSQISSKFKPLSFTDAQRADLLTFLKTGLRDPDVVRYAPRFVMSGNCFPNSDSVSVEQMGCD